MSLLPIKEQNSSGVLKIERELRDGLLLANWRESLFSIVMRTHASPTRREKDDGARLNPIEVIGILLYDPGSKNMYEW